MKELTETFIDKDVFIKQGKKFFKSIIEKLNIEAKVEVDRIGIGCGPHLIINHETFILKAYGSSFGSGDRVGSCYVMIQPKCSNMPQPFDLGHVTHYTLAYYVNNPKYLLNNLSKAMNETFLWDTILKQKIDTKWLKKPHKYLLKLEKASEALKKVFDNTDHLESNKASYYFNDLKNLILKTYQEKISKKEVKCKDKHKYRNNMFLPYKDFKVFADKHKSKIIGTNNKYFYSDKASGLFFKVVETYPYKFIKMKRSKFDKIKTKLKKYDPLLHKKLFSGSINLYTVNTSITYTGILKCFHTVTT